MRFVRRKLHRLAVFALLSVLLLSACSGFVSACAENEEPPCLQDDNPVPEQDGLSQNVFTVVDGEIYWMCLSGGELAEHTAFLQEALDLSMAAAAGVLSNIQLESEFDPNRLGDGGAAFGICQWRGARLEQMVCYCLENDLDPGSLEGQMAFLVYDLKENYIYPYDLIRTVSDNADGAGEAAWYFCAYYEAPTDPDAAGQNAVELAENLYYPALLELQEEG